MILFCVLQKKTSHRGLKSHEGEYLCLNKPASHIKHNELWLVAFCLLAVIDQMSPKCSRHNGASHRSGSGKLLLAMTTKTQTKQCWHSGKVFECQWMAQTPLKSGFPVSLTQPEWIIKTKWVKLKPITKGFLFTHLLYVCFISHVWKPILAKKK